VKNHRFTVPLMVALVILLASFSILAGCSSSSPTTAPATNAPPTTSAPVTKAPTTTAVASTTTPATAAPTTTAASPTGAVKPIVLKLTTHNPPALSVSQTEKLWADKIKEMSGGRLEFQLYYSESLAKQSEVFKAVQTGVADIGYMVVGSDASQTPLSMITRRTFMGMPSMKANNIIWWELFNKYPEIQAEWKNMKVLTVNGLPPDQFFFTKKAVRLPADMQGMKVIARGDYPAIMSAIGAVPVGLNVADWYSGVEKGLVEGQVGIHYLAVNSFKLLDLYKYVTDFGDGGADMATEIHAINLDTWNKLPPDLQKILLDSCKWYEEEELKSTTDGYNAGVQAGKDKGINVVKLTPEELAQWQKVVEGLDQQWITIYDAKGPARLIYNDAKALMKKYADVK
jgi:TRAP-type C4-dicarboxylate transport system substrate-binding protein